MMKKTMKRPMKKADGGDVKTTATKGKAAASSRPSAPIAGFPGRGAGLRTAMENANANARFNRPATGGPMAPSRPAAPSRPVVTSPAPGPIPRNVEGRPAPITTMPLRPLKKGGTPMRKASGGMAKGKKK